MALVSFALIFFMLLCTDKRSKEALESGYYPNDDLRDDDFVKVQRSVLEQLITTSERPVVAIAETETAPKNNAFNQQLLCSTGSPEGQNSTGVSIAAKSATITESAMIEWPAVCTSADNQPPGNTDIYIPTSQHASTSGRSVDLAVAVDPPDSDDDVHNDEDMVGSASDSEKVPTYQKKRTKRLIDTTLVPSEYSDLKQS